MAGLAYRIPINGLSIGSGVVTADIVEALNGATNPITIHRIQLSSKSVTTNEFYNIQLIKRTTGGTGGGTITPIPKADINSRSAALTANGARVTTVGTASTVYMSLDWNILVPFDEVHGKAPLEIELPANIRWGLFLNGTLAGTRVFDGYIDFEER